jgi:hypothetical protein
VTAATDPAVAAALLASLNATTAARIISDMAPREAQQVIKMTMELTSSTTTPSPPAIPAPGPATSPNDAHAHGHDDGDEPREKPAKRRHVARSPGRHGLDDLLRRIPGGTRAHSASSDISGYQYR